MTFQDQQLNSMTFQAWKIKFLNSMTVQVFHDLYEPCQRAKKVVSNSLGLVDFAIGLVNSVLNLPDGQVMCLRNSNNKNCEINSAHQKAFGAS